MSASILALRTDDPDEAVKYDLAAVLYSYQLLFGRNFITQNLGRYDPLTYQAVRTYNSALARFYAYLDSKGLQDNASYCLQTADGRNIIFQSRFTASRFRAHLIKASCYARISKLKTSPISLMNSGSAFP